MDLLIKESLCRPEQKKDFIASLMTTSGQSLGVEQSEDYTEYTSSPSKSTESNGDGLRTSANSFSTGDGTNTAPAVFEVL